MPRMVLYADFPLAAVAMLGLLNVACSNDRACPLALQRCWLLRPSIYSAFGRIDASSQTTRCRHEFVIF